MTLSKPFAHAYCDGRGNAGTGACACVIYYRDMSMSAENPFARLKKLEKAIKLGPVTNNVAEYQAVILTIREAVGLKLDRLFIRSDSQLIVNQLLGKYDVKNEELRVLRDECWKLGMAIQDLKIEWVPRSETKVPDKLCRQIDKKQAARSRPKPLR